MPERALQHFSQAVALSPDNVAYRTRLAALLGERNRFDEAIAHFLAAQAL